MKTYLVGGAVRDKLLGIPVKERDWVVVGSTPEQMLSLGFEQVGKEFPVFLHPETKEEYALARKERKQGHGYKGFICEFDEKVTLEEDLLRRDLTINAMAEDESGNLIDPYEGYKDLRAKQLRHVSKAFVEDPVRLLRLARFAARLPDFGIASETNSLMKQVVQSGELDHLVAERVWNEWKKSLAAKAPGRFFEVLERVRAIRVLFPELVEHVQSLSIYLTKAAQLSKDPLDRFVCTMLATQSEAKCAALAKRYRLPSNYENQAVLILRHVQSFRNARELDQKNILDLFYNLDAFRRQPRFETWLHQCQLAAAVMSNGFLIDFSDIHQLLKTAFDKVATIRLSSEELSEKAGEQIAEFLYQKRLTALTEN